MSVKMNPVETICENRDFRRTYARGKSFIHPALCTYVLKNRRSRIRIGITAGKKVGNAVLRNRARRIIREGFRTAGLHFKGGFDLVFVARTKTPSLKSTDLSKIIVKSLAALGVCENTGGAVQSAPAEKALKK